jgi:adenine-specific DNA-methyltransferase
MPNNRNTKLELTWIGKDQHPRLEPRLLLEDDTLSYHANRHVTDNDIFDNRLIFGDNLLALKALEQEFTGRVKCIYIDPPFNTGQAMEHYEDGLEHSTWLNLIANRIRILHSLLSQDGTLFVHIDDNELGYLLVLMDEVFGRTNRLYVVTFKQGSPTGHKAINPGCVNTSNFVLIYAKDKSLWKPNRVFTARERDNRYSQVIVNFDDGYERWYTLPLIKSFANQSGLTEKDARKQIKNDPSIIDKFVMRNAQKVVRLARPDYESVSEAARHMIDESTRNPSSVYRLQRDGYPDIYLKGGERILFYSDKLKLIDGEYVSGEPLTTIWDDLLSNNLHNEGGVQFPKGKKPESLIKRVLDLSTIPGDLVLDSFAGSGTTGAVAHKMGRRWIMVELGEHCHTHIIPRLKKVIDGTDQGGVSQAANWQGGGGFRYYRLAASLLEKDKWGNWVINKTYNAAMLAEAVCKLHGFTYAPSEEFYWQQGHSTERDFIYVTTQTLSREQLAQLSEEVGPNRSLLICCGAYLAPSPEEFANLTVRKIPNAVLSRCEWGHDDYSLSVANLPPPAQMEPMANLPDDAAQPENQAQPRDSDAQQPRLFNDAATPDVSEVDE